MSEETSQATIRADNGIAIKRVLCGVDGSRTDAETVREAATLAGADGAIDLVCVTHTSGYGMTEQSFLGRSRAERALSDAHAVAQELGVHATIELVADRDRWSGLGSRILNHDLLVLGGHKRSRAEGILGGSLATEALHRSPLPVLIARETEHRFPKTILLATDGGPDCRVAAAFAAGIAERHGASVTLLTVGSDRDGRHELAEGAADIFRACGVEPVLVVEGGSPRTAIVNVIRAQGPSLAILGSGGKLGVRAIGSVSEHVAHHVDCSVLIARGRRG